MAPGARVTAATPAPRFDDVLDAWVLTRFDDVSAALRDPRISPGGAHTDDDTARRVVRGGVAEVLTPRVTPAATTDWRSGLEADARRQLDALPRTPTVDLVETFAAPWAITVAAQSLALPRATVLAGLTPARQLFLDAAFATNAEPSATSLAASRALLECLAHTGAGANPAAVQAFVALTQTVPALLASAWLALLQHPDQLALLRERGMTSGAVAELLRHAGPSRAVFRTARTQAEIGGHAIGAGERLVLRLDLANRDPDRFADPDRLDLTRPGGPHLSFGAGAHRCAASAMVTTLLVLATERLLAACDVIELAEGAVEGVDWIDGFAIRAPSRLPVSLRCATDRGTARDQQRFG